MKIELNNVDTKFNRFQSTLEDIDFFKLPDEVKEQFLECLISIEFIRNLVSVKRPYVQDLPRDEKGRAIIDFTNPPLYENADFFRPTGLLFEKEGVLNPYKPNPAKQSDYYKWVGRDVYRSYNGYLNKETGMWIPGDMYWYLNYCMMDSIVEGEDGIEYNRVITPSFWEGQWWRFLGWYEARKQKLNFAEIASRRKGKSSCAAGRCSRDFYLGESQAAQENIKNLYVADSAIYLNKGGVLNLFEKMIDFIAQNTNFAHERLQSSLNDMIWVSGYTDLNTKTKMGSLNQVQGITISDDPDKPRGKAANFIYFEEFGNFGKLQQTYDTTVYSVKQGKKTRGLVVLAGCVCEGTKVYKADGTPINVEDLQQDDGILGYDLENDCISKESITYMQPPAYKECVRITTKNRTLECSTDHPIFTRLLHSKKITKTTREYWYTWEFVEAGKLTNKNATSIVIQDSGFLNFGIKKIKDPYFVGLLIGDGSYGYDKTPRISNDDYEVLGYVKKKYDTTVERGNITKEGKGYEELRIRGICSYLKELGIYTQTGLNKTLPIDYQEYDQETSSLLLAGLFDTDGCVTSDFISYSSICLPIIKGIQFLLSKFGIKSNYHISKARLGIGRKDKNDVYVLCICGYNNFLKFNKYIPLKVNYKIKKLKKLLSSTKALKGKYSANTKVEKIIKIEKIGIKRIYNLTADNTHTYLANDIITHNTGGTRGANFQGALDMIYNPKAMGILPYRNVWDTNQTDNSIFFFPAYVNYEGCINKDGISDVTASLKEILLYRHSKKYGTASPSSLAQAIAEQPITIQDSIMKTDESIFPTAAITERILDLDKNPNSLSDIYVGVMVLNSNGEAEFRPTADAPIRQYPHTAGEKRPGAIEIIEMPIKDKDGKIPYGRYISSCLKKGEKVNTTAGLKTVEDVTINDTLIDIDGNESKIKRIIQKYNIFPVYKVKLWSIYDTTTFTKDHPIYCSTPKRKYNGIRKVRESGLPERYWVNNFNFRKVEDLKVGDIVKVPNIYNKEKPFLHFWKDDSRIDRKISNPLDNEEFWWFIGFLLGDGWCAKNGYRITICLNVVDENYYEKIERIVKTLFKRNFCYSRQCGKIKNLMFSYKYLNSFIVEHFSKYAKNKQIPEWVKYIPNNLKKQLVLGYLASDGYITKENYAEFVSVSKKLLCDIQDILFSMGVRSGVTKMRGRKVHTINNHVSKTKPTYHLRCYLLDTEKIVNWDRTDLKCSRYTYVPTNPNRKRDIKNVYFSDDLNYIYFKVYKIDIEEYEGPVYNFECDTHTFMCNYIPTHNCDPVDDDSTNTETLSLQSFFMFDLWTDTIVAEYTGRTEFAVDFYEQTRLLNAFYNAKMMYENNKKGVFSYYQRMHSLKYMAETPEYLKSKGLQPRYNIGNKAYGIHNIGSINATGLEFLRDWLCSPVTIYISDPEDESKVKETEVMRLYTLKNRAFLQELAKYNPLGNYDRISSMIMLMLYREEKLIVKGFNTWEQLNNTQNGNDEDPTFFNEYERRYKKQSKVFGL